MSRRTRRSRRRPLLVLVTLLLAAGAFVLWTRSGDSAPAAAESPGPTTSAAAPSTAEPSSDAPSQDPGAGTGEEADEEPSSRPSATTSAPEPEEDQDAGELTAVSVALTYTGYDAAAGAVVAGGYADGVVEEDATCTLLLRRDGVELYDESLGTANVTTTDCGELRVGGDELTSGTWEAVLSYTSDTSIGESAAGEVVVP
jgi:hypothetical protein